VTASSGPAAPASALYYYVDEGPGEVRCHNVDLHGGLWWVVGADGERRR
jgi:hypothetical protein